VYEEYLHLDQLLSDTSWLPQNVFANILYNLWKAVKDAVRETEDEEAKDE
jgi:hypothetical protein